MFCRECGGDVREGASFCPKCGALAASPPQPGQEDVVGRDAHARAETPSQTAVPRRSHAFAAWGIGAAIVVVLVAGTVVAFQMGMLGRQSTASSADSAQSQTGSTSDASSAALETSGSTVQTGALHAVDLNTPERLAIMDAIHAWLGTTKKKTDLLWVNRGTQLSAQGEFAVADIALQSKGTGRMFVVLQGVPWKVAWSAPYGAPSANEAALTNAVPGIPGSLVAGIQWNLSWEAKK